MDITYLLVWLLIGGVAGFLAGTFMGSRSPFGMIGDIVLGILGAVVGGWLLGALGFTASGLLGTLVTAFIGAVVLIAGIRVVKRA
jgi:Predicted membrane protein